MDRFYGAVMMTITLILGALKKRLTILQKISAFI